LLDDLLRAAERVALEGDHKQLQEARGQFNAIAAAAYRAFERHCVERNEDDAGIVRQFFGALGVKR
jgi:hypothetical protein